jgi:hypothetical protein
LILTAENVNPSLGILEQSAMAIDYHFDMAKIPKGMSFPLKRSRLDAALIESGISSVCIVYYRLRQSGDIVLRGNFCGEQPRDRAMAGQFSITIYAVPSGQRSQVELAIEADLLPRLIQWLREIEQAGNVRRATDKHFTAYWSDGESSVKIF